MFSREILNLRRRGSFRSRFGFRLAMLLRSKVDGVLMTPAAAILVLSGAHYRPGDESLESLSYFFFFLPLSITFCFFSLSHPLGPLFPCLSSFVFPTGEPAANDVRRFIPLLAL